MQYLHVLLIVVIYFIGIMTDVQNLLAQLSTALQKNEIKTEDASTQVEFDLNGFYLEVSRKWEEPVHPIRGKKGMKRPRTDSIIREIMPYNQMGLGEENIECESDSCIVEDNSDNDSVCSIVIGRRGGIFTGRSVSKKDPITGKGKPGGLCFTTTLRKPSETWAMANDRCIEADMPFIKKRSKCLRLIAKQDGITIDKAIVKYKENTTTELFYLVKKTSPQLISSRKDDDMYEE